MLPLRIGTAEMEITPDNGIAMAGSLVPRYSTGVDDPLYVRAIVLDNGETCLAYVSFDLCVLDRAWADGPTAAASEATGIPVSHITWACSHTHSGPYTAVMHYNPADWADALDEAWMARLEAAFVECVKAAHADLSPARMLRTRAFCYDVQHNRRLRLKDGTDINTWLVENCPQETQCLGSAAPIDPEIGILAFADEAGAIRAVLWNFALHANIHFGSTISADYPGVVARILRERFGEQCMPLYLPGACGDINGLRDYVATGEILGEKIAAAVTAGVEDESLWRTSVPLGAQQAELTVPCHDFAAGNEERIQASRWQEWTHPFFREGCTEMARAGLSTRTTVLKAWHVGDLSVASVPGELFVEWGLYLKERGAFPWTYPVELANDWIGYLITEQAWERIGYEGIPSMTSQITPAGVKQMMDELLRMLYDMHSAMDANTGDGSDE